MASAINGGNAWSRLAVRTDRAHLHLLRDRGLLQELANSAILLPAIDAMVLGDVGADKSSDAGDPGP